MAPRKLYEDKLQKLNQSVMEMGQFAERLIDKTIQAIIQNDHDLANSIIKQDDVVDNMQLEIEKECVRLIAQEQPVARDLRFIISVVKIVTDLERIADQCCDICEYSIWINDGTWNRETNYKRHIEKMALSTKAMLSEALNAFITKDLNVIKETCKADDKIDSIFDKVWQEITDQMMEDKNFIQNGVHYIMIIKYLERIADHITNIAEWILFSSTGEYIIHQHIE